MTDAVKDLAYRWVFFEHVPDACRHNIERDAQEKGRAPQKRLQALEDCSHRYCIPPEVTAEPVLRKSGQQCAQQRSGTQQI